MASDIIFTSSTGDLDITELEESDLDPMRHDGFQQVPASEPDLNKKPKKSALKSRLELNGTVPVTPVSDSSANDSSHTDSSSSSVSNGVKSVQQFQAKPSPLATPLSGNIGRPRLRAGFV